MKYIFVTECCWHDADENETICYNCGKPCKVIEIEEDDEPVHYKSHPLTGAVRAAMKTEPNGDKYIPE